MADEWRARPLKDCAVWYSGGTPSKGNPDYWGGAIPWISAKSLVDFFVCESDDKVTELGASNGTRLVPENTILFIVRGMSLKSEFRMGITTRPVTFNQDLKALVPVDDVLPAFLAYAIKARTPEILGLVGEAGHGTGVLPTDRIQALEILLPLLPEQRAIAHILGTLDDKIELNRRMNETLEATARALFKSWFIDFDPVRAKAEGCQPAGMDAETAGLFPDTFEDAEHGPIPRSWRVESLDSIAHFQNGLALQRFRPEPGEDCLPVVKIAQLRSGKTNAGEWARATIKPSCILDDGDVVFSWSGSLLVRVWCGGRAALNQHLFRVSSDRFPRWFYLYWTRHHLSEFVRIAADKATTMGHIKRRHLTEARCVVPPPELIEAVGETLSTLVQRQVGNECESRTLAAMRDALLPPLLSGEIRIQDAETFLEART